MSTMNTRHWTLRKLESVLTNMDWVGTHVIDIIKVYEEQHPEISEALHDILNAMTVLYESVQKIKGAI